jgi:hypothetical protein
MTHRLKEKLALLMHESPKIVAHDAVYGLDGISGRTETLHWLMIRLGLLASLRSKATQGLLRAFDRSIDEH